MFYKLEIFFAGLGVKSPLTAGVTSNIGSVLLEVGDNLQALDFYKSATDIVTGLAAQKGGTRSNLNTDTKDRSRLDTTENDGQTEGSRFTAEQTAAMEWPISYNLALVQNSIKNYGLSLEVCKRALELGLSIWGENDSRVGDVFQLISDNLLEMGLKQDSLEFLEKAIKTYQDNESEHANLKLLNCKEKRIIAMAEQLESREELRDIMDELEDILSGKVGILGESSVLVADTYFNLGKLAQLQGEHRASVAYWRKCFSILSQKVEIYFSEASKVGLGTLPAKGQSTERQWVQTQKLPCTLNAHQELLTSLRGQRILSRLLKVLHLLITLEFNQGKFEQVEELIAFFNQKLDLAGLCKPQSQVAKSGGQEVLSLLRNLRMAINGIAPLLLLHFGKAQEAYSVATQGVEDCKREYGESHPKTFAAFFKLGSVCRELGGEKSAEAELYFSLVDQAVQEELAVCQQRGGKSKKDGLLADPQFALYRAKLEEYVRGQAAN